MTHKSIYLDNNSTTHMLPEVAHRLAVQWQQSFSNPSSQHAAGRHARKALADAIRVIAQILGVQQTGPERDQIILTSGGTESNNLALRGLVGQKPAKVIVSAIEHPSVLATAEWLQQQGHEVVRLAVDRNGLVNPQTMLAALTGGTRLVSIMMGNNETGVIQPIAELAAICRQHNVVFHTDAVQAVGKVDVDFRSLGVDALSLTAHKFHGPRGIGALVVRGSVELQPLLMGGAQQLGKRPGTESVELTCAMADALRQFAEDPAARKHNLSQLRDLFESLVIAGCPQAVVHSQSVDRLPHTSNISIPGLNRQSLLMALDRAGVYCSTGSACSSGSSEPSHVLRAMGCPQEWVESSLRFSLGCLTTEEEIRMAAERFLAVISAQKQPGSSGMGVRGTTREFPQKLL